MTPEPAFSFAPLTPDRFSDLETLFGPKGAAEGCWCMSWRLRRKDWNAGTGEDRHAAFETRVGDGPPPGVLAYDGDRPVGWVQVTTRDDVPRFTGTPTGRAAEDIADAWVITCFFVAKDYRNAGLMPKLIAAACDFARDHGAKAVEAAPIDPQKPLIWGEGFVGVASAFRANGFEEIERRTPRRPFMRKLLA